MKVAYLVLSPLFHIVLWILPRGVSENRAITKYKTWAPLRKGKEEMLSTCERKEIQPFLICQLIHSSVFHSYPTGSVRRDWWWNLSQPCKAVNYKISPGGAQVIKTTSLCALGPSAIPDIWGNQIIQITFKLGSCPNFYTFSSSNISYKSFLI